jgi:hypothetical protein
MVICPSGWTRTTTSRVKSPACCIDTTEGLELIPGVKPGRRPYQGRRLPLHQISVERMAGLEPAPQDLEGPWATVTPHSLWFGLRDSHPSLHAGNVECSFHTQAEHGPVTFTGHRCPSVVKEPALASYFHSYRPYWRQRQDSNPDPRVLEARMLPLHHAADIASSIDRFERQNLPVIWPVLFSGFRPKQKRPSRGSP